MSLNTLDGAISEFTKSVGGQFKGMSRPKKVAGIVSARKKIFYVFFKRDWLHSYSKLFPQEADKGFGQSVSLSVLREAVKEGATIVIVFPDGKMYTRIAKDWLDYSKKYGTIRQAHDGDVTASVPSNSLQRFES